MITVVVVLHLIITAAMIGLILLQKSEGNAAGGGFGASSSVSGMMQPRSRPNPISRATAIFGIGFFATSLGLALLAKQAGGPAQSILTNAPGIESSAPKVDEIQAPAAGAAPEAATPAPPVNAAPAGPPAVPTVPNN